MQFLQFPHNVHMNSHSNDYIKYPANSNKYIKDRALSGLFEAFSSLTCSLLLDDKPCWII